MSVAKSEGGNPSANSGTSGENKNLSPGSGQVWPARNYIGRGRLARDMEHTLFRNEYASRNRPYNSNVDYSGKMISRTHESKSAEDRRIGNTFRACVFGGG